MKTTKKLLLLVLIFISMNTNATIEVSDTSLKHSSSQSMISNENGDNVKNFLVLFGGKLDEGMQNGYDIFVQQQRVYAYQYVSLIIIGVIYLILSVIFFSKIKYSNDKNDIKPTIHLSFGIGSLLFSVVLLIFGFSHYGMIVQGLFNPDYAAIIEILELVKSTIQ